jgi:hypothetical protein
MRRSAQVPCHSFRQKLTHRSYNSVVTNARGSSLAVMHWNETCVCLESVEHSMMSALDGGSSSVLSSRHARFTENPEAYFYRFEIGESTWQVSIAIWLRSKVGTHSCYWLG